MLSCRVPRNAMALALVLIGPATASAAIVNVTNATELQNAISAASAGDVITLAPGTYDVTSTLSCAASGTSVDPIVVRAASLGDALVRLDSIAGSALVLFSVSAPHWQFENLEIQGICIDDADCEHAFQLVGDADFARVSGSLIRDFNIPIRGNIGSGAFPDDVVIEGVELRNSAARNVATPVALIEAIGGRRWIIRDNILADSGKLLGSAISHAAVLRGNSRDGVMEGNLVICEDAHSDGTRLGLSLGGGGTSPGFLCEDGTCTPEHQNGLIRNNVILRCPDDRGIYLNEAASAGIYNNTLVGSLGIEAEFAASVADVRNNLTSGSIDGVGGATVTDSSNVAGVSLATFDAWFGDPDLLDFSLQDGTSFVDLGEVLADVTDDFCANGRDDGSPDRGAVEYDADLGPCDPITVLPEPARALGLAAGAALLGYLGRRRFAAPRS